MERDGPFIASTDEILRMDEQVVHPWESFDLPHQNRMVVGHGSGLYVQDSEGNRLLDAPAGMWCVNVGHGRREIIDAIVQQLSRLSYTSPWSHPTEPAARLAHRLSHLSPGDLNHVFYTTGGSTAVDSALRFVAFYNNVRGRPEKKHILPDLCNFARVRTIWAWLAEWPDLREGSAVLADPREFALL